jgi:hypothetical protein
MKYAWLFLLSSIIIKAEDPSQWYSALCGQTPYLAIWVIHFQTNGDPEVEAEKICHNSTFRKNLKCYGVLPGKQKNFKAFNKCVKKGMPSSTAKNQDSKKPLNDEDSLLESIEHLLHKTIKSEALNKKSLPEIDNNTDDENFLETLTLFLENNHQKVEPVHS